VTQKSPLLIHQNILINAWEGASLRAMTPAAPLASIAPAAGAPALPVLFKALGDELRLQVLRLLKDESLNVSELCEVFQLKQSALSHHLKILVQAKLLGRKKEGTVTFYRREVPEGVQESLLAEVLRQIDTTALSPLLQRGLLRVQAVREQHSRAFFRDNSERLREQQELIASWEDYSNATLHLLERTDNLADASVLEIGPGDGSLLPALAERAGSVTGLDNSEEMLALAKARTLRFENVVLVLGEAEGLLGDKRQFDVVIANMVLHHTPDPAALLRAAGQLLAPGGRIIISELCAHDQLWAREHCGDLWLGFEAGQLSDWAHAAGLESRAELFLAQRNGFQIQVRLFQKQTNR